jgi:hypothetical protein
VIHVIFIPVLFVCANGECNFMQAQKPYMRETECRAQLEVQKENIKKMSVKAGTPITLIEGTCITAKDGML